MLFPDTLGYFLLNLKLKLYLFFKPLSPWLNYNLILKIKSVQSDWGGEYRPFSALLASHDISHKIICPHTHHQNGVVERKHRHIVDLGLTLLYHASLPLQFWDYAFTTAICLVNRLPTALSLLFLMSLGSTRTLIFSFLKPLVVHAFHY